MGAKSVRIHAAGWLLTGALAAAPAVAPACELRPSGDAEDLARTRAEAAAARGELPFDALPAEAREHLTACRPGLQGALGLVAPAARGPDDLGTLARWARVEARRLAAQGAEAEAAEVCLRLLERLLVAAESDPASGYVALSLLVSATGTCVAVVDRAEAAVQTRTLSRLARLAEKLPDPVSPPRGPFDRHDDVEAALKRALAGGQPEAAVRAALALEAARAAVAADLHFRAHGAWPRSGEALVGAGLLARVPRDPRTGEALELEDRGVYLVVRASAPRRGAAGVCRPGSHSVLDTRPGHPTLRFFVSRDDAPVLALPAFDTCRSGGLP